MIIIGDNVSLDVREDSISLSAFDPDAGESKELISAMGNAAVIINLSGKYLLDALSLVTCADVEIMVKDAKSAVVIKTDTDSFIIMPMKG
jgi:DNA polymerase III sliding clamp (beta) subunit (PCNA family)